jgi:acyl-CoA thioester hydrolase
MTEAAFERGHFRRFEQIAARWNDIDVFGHVNNAVFYELFDTIVLRLLTSAGSISRNSPYAALVAESGAKFHREVLFSDRIDVGIRCAKLGTTSLIYELGLFTAERSDSAVDGRMVHVFVDRDTRRPSRGR